MNVITTYDLWMFAIAALVAIGCALPGTFLVLRRQSMLADAVSHSVLPGLILAYLISGRTASTTLVVGALVAGFLASLLVEWVQRRLRLEGGAAIGLVFTSMFALGLLLLRRTADHVHLDADCVLFGGLESAPVETLATVFGPVPRAVIVVGVVVVLEIAIVVLFFKELRATTFDPAQAQMQGISVRAMHRLLLGMTALSCVAAFEAVGSILVLALIVVPAAAAVMLGRRLASCMVLACGLGVGAVLLGLAFSRVFPLVLASVTGAQWMQRVHDVNAAGSIAVASGMLFAGALGWKVRSAHRAPTAMATAEPESNVG